MASSKATNPSSSSSSSSNSGPGAPRFKFNGYGRFNSIVNFKGRIHSIGGVQLPTHLEGILRLFDAPTIQTDSKGFDYFIEIKLRTYSVVSDSVFSRKLEHEHKFLTSPFRDSKSEFSNIMNAVLYRHPKWYFPKGFLNPTKMDVCIRSSIKLAAAKEKWVDGVDVLENTRSECLEVHDGIMLIPQLKTHNIEEEFKAFRVTSIYQKVFKFA